MHIQSFGSDKLICLAQIIRLSFLCLIASFSLFNFLKIYFFLSLLTFLLFSSVFSLSVRLSYALQSRALVCSQTKLPKTLYFYCVKKHLRKLLLWQEFGPLLLQRNTEAYAQIFESTLCILSTRYRFSGEQDVVTRSDLL